MLNGGVAVFDVLSVPRWELVVLRVVIHRHARLEIRVRIHFEWQPKTERSRYMIKVERREKGNS
jgi:hypothetical protein